ncbi:hypothetical protein E4U54_000145 [Claviceps lovelessii]|nr:hypothetical protein E4U54_000145 [Claviceps lovelessii]
MDFQAVLLLAIPGRVCRKKFEGVGQRNGAGNEVMRLRREPTWMEVTCDVKRQMQAGMYDVSGPESGLRRAGKHKYLVHGRGTTSHLCG